MIGEECAEWASRFSVGDIGSTEMLAPLCCQGDAMPVGTPNTQIDPIRGRGRVIVNRYFRESNSTNNW